MKNRFHEWAFQNFPFMEETYKEIDNYHLMMDIMHFLKEQSKDFKYMTEKFEELEQWFNNLDVQEEINNKLDEMAESGELEEIISAYLNSKAIFGFDTISDMLSAENLIAGSYAKTSGYHSINDGGSATYRIRERSYEDVIDNGLLHVMETSEDLVAEMIVTDSTVNVKQFGAYGDNEHDDTTSIQNAINSLDGGLVIVDNGVYLISSPIVLKAGIKLSGVATYDPNSIKTSAMLKLANGSNCSVLQSPYAHNSSAGATHYIEISNLCINGNMSNQTVETIAIDLDNVYIGSKVENVFVENFYGTAINVEQSDIELSNVWIMYGYTTSGKYAFDTNMRLTGDTRGNILKLSQLFVENYANQSGVDVATLRSDSTKRSNAIRLQRCVQVYGEDIHVEGSGNAITLSNNFAIQLESVSLAFVGNTNATDNTVIKINNVQRFTSITNLSNTNVIQATYWIKKATGFSNNNIPDYAYSNDGGLFSVMPKYIIQNDTPNAIITPRTYFSNISAVRRIGSFDTIGFRFIYGTDTQYGYINQKQETMTLGSRYNQSAEKPFLHLDSYGSNADRLRCAVPIQLANNSDPTTLGAGAIYRLDSSAYGTNVPAYQQTSSTWSWAMPIACVKTSTADPSVGAPYLGCLWLNTSSGKVWIAKSVGGTTDDWSALN